MSGENTLQRTKNEYQESHGLSDQPMDVVVTCTLGKNCLKRIQESENGLVVRFSDMIDNYKSVKEDLENFLRFNYLPHDQNYELKFLLKGLDICDIQSPDNNNNLILGGSLAMPNIHGLSFPTDHINGTFKKLFDLKRSRNYVLGRPHAFVHALKHSGVGNVYNLIHPDAVTNHKVLFPGDSSVKQPGAPLLYSWLVDNDTFYDGSDYPHVVRYLRPNGTDSLRTDYRVNIPESSFLRSWHRNNSKFDNETGCDIPLELHAKSVYGFLDTLHHHRATSFERSGIWWDVQQLRESPIKFNLKFSMHPIVPIVENKESLPYHNYKRGLRMQLHEHQAAF
jgi:hypothetical protein